MKPIAGGLARLATWCWLAGCMNVPLSARSFRLTTGNAPPPTLLMGVLACREGTDFPRRPTDREVGGSQLESYARRMTVALARLGTVASAPAEAGCSLVKKLKSDVSQRWAELVAPDDVIRAMSTSGAKSALVTVVLATTVATDTADGRVWYESMLFAGALLFDREGHALWRGSEVVMMQDQPPAGRDRDLERDPTEIYRDLPVSASALPHLE